MPSNPTVSAEGKMRNVDVLWLCTLIEKMEHGTGTGVQIKECNSGVTISTGQCVRMGLRLRSMKYDGLWMLYAWPSDVVLLSNRAGTSMVNIISNVWYRHGAIVVLRSQLQPADCSQFNRLGTIVRSIYQ